MDILICTLGTSSWVLAESYDFLVGECDHYFKDETHIKKTRKKLLCDRTISDLEVWVVTTQTLGQQKNKELTYWQNQHNKRCRLFCAAGTNDLEDDEQNKNMLETIYRVVLKANEECGSGGIYLSLAGGRKTMSAYLQQSETFFDIAGIFHVINADEEKVKSILEENGGDKFQPSNMNRIKKLLYPHVRPVCLMKSSWEKMMAALISFSGEKSLSSKDFPIEEIPLISWSCPKSYEEPTVQNCLQQAMKSGKEFTDMLLSAGSSVATLFHDLCGTDGEKLNTPVIQDALSDYLAGINMLFDSRKDYGSKVNIKEFKEKIIIPALHLAGYQSTKLSIEIEVDDIDMRISRPLLLILLRNLLKNALEHGEPGTVRCKAIKTGESCRISVSNKVDEQIIKEERWKKILIPFASSKTTDGDGLGGIAAKTAAEILAPKQGLQWQQPTLENRQIEFYVDIEQKQEENNKKISQEAPKTSLPICVHISSYLSSPSCGFYSEVQKYDKEFADNQFFEFTSRDCFDDQELHGRPFSKKLMENAKEVLFIVHFNDMGTKDWVIGEGKNLSKNTQYWIGYSTTDSNIVPRDFPKHPHFSWESTLRNNICVFLEAWRKKVPFKKGC